MAYTPVGGEILFIESSRVPGRGNITLTGQIGEVMKESATAAFSLIRARATELGIDPKLLADSDIHIHVPAGAIPKDGPSAGITMTTALASLFSGRKVKPLLAMTGEVTLSGRVLPIGGLKEKALGARRAGITTIICPERNRKDAMEDLPTEIRNDIKFEFVKDVSEVLDLALLPAETESVKGEGASGTATGPASRQAVKRSRPSSRSTPPAAHSTPTWWPNPRSRCPIRSSRPGYWTRG